MRFFQRRINWWYLYYGLGTVGLIVILTYIQKGPLPW